MAGICAAIHAHRGKRATSARQADPGRCDHDHPDACASTGPTRSPTSAASRSALTLLVPWALWSVGGTFATGSRASVARR